MERSLILFVRPNADVRQRQHRVETCPTRTVTGNWTANRRCRPNPDSRLLESVGPKRPFNSPARFWLCLVLAAEARHDAEQQNDSRPRMLCPAIGIGTAVDTLLEQFSRRKHGG